MKTIATFCPSPMPSQSIVSGIQVIDGSGRSSETNGSIAALAGSHTAMTMPSGIATAPASAKPSSTRCVDIQMSLSSCPLAKLATASATTRPGLGRKTGDTHPRSVDRYQSASTNRTDRALISSRTGLRLLAACAVRPRTATRPDAPIRSDTGPPERISARCVARDRRDTALAHFGMKLRFSQALTSGILAILPLSTSHFERYSIWPVCSFM